MFISPLSLNLLLNLNYLPLNLQKWGIYNTPCNGCDSTYNGQTKSNLKIRLNEYSCYVINLEISISYDAKNSWDFGHTFNFGKLDFLEKLAIYYSHEFIVNYQSDTQILSVAWKMKLSANM